jgi:ferredoxin
MAQVPPALEDKVRLAVRNCPEGALRVTRQDGAASKGELQ